MSSERAGESAAGTVQQLFLTFVSGEWHDLIAIKQDIDGFVHVAALNDYGVGTHLDDLCEATESAIAEGGGFGWLKPPPRQVLENYWKGTLLVPERWLVVGVLPGLGGTSAVARVLTARMSM